MWLWLVLASCWTTERRPGGEPSPPEPVVGGPTVRIHPGVRDVPLNALEFRLEWSEPMAFGPHQAAIRDAHGKTVPGGIERLAWEPGFQVAWIEPHGTKVGALYTLHVEGFRSAAGKPAAPVDQAFVVRPEDTEAPSGKGIVPMGKPLPGTTGPIEIRFPEPMALDTLGALTVLVGGRPAEGRWTLEDGDTLGRFSPAGPWPEGLVNVAISAGVRDLGGNEMVDRPVGMLVPMAPAG